MSRVRLQPSEPRSQSRSLQAPAEQLQAAFLALRTARDVAQLLDVPYWQLTYLLFRLPPDERYTSVEIKKRGGGVRQLLVPCAGLAMLQRKLLQVLSAVYVPKPCVHGFVKDRSIVSNAKQHVRRSWVLNIDLRDFFPTIHFGRVRGVFRAKPYGLPDAAATALAQICCHENQLPQGAPTSPVVSNMVCARLDSNLMMLAKRHKMMYSRFADDLTFSTTMSRFPEEVAFNSTQPAAASVGPALARVLDANDFRSNPQKCRMQSVRQRQEVTGITVSKFPNVPRAFVRRTRAMMHAWEKFGYAAAEQEYLGRYNRRHRAPHRDSVEFKNVVRGHLAYLAMVRGYADPLVLRLYTRYAALDPQFAGRRLLPLHETVRATLWVLECEETASQGSAFAVSGVGLVTCEHVLGTATHAFRTSRPDQKIPVELVALSKELDLAVLRLPEPLGPALSIDWGYQPAVGDQVNVAGFPNHQTGDTGHFLGQRVVAMRSASGHERALVDGPIAAGMSGGPVVDSKARAIGVVVSGAETISQANMTERHGFVPIKLVVRFLEANGLIALTPSA